MSQPPGDAGVHQLHQDTLVPPKAEAFVPQKVLIPQQAGRGGGAAEVVSDNTRGMRMLSFCRDQINVLVHDLFG